MIEAENLTFAYPKSEKNLFQNLSFQVEPGEKVALTGPSGIGKTTLIQILTGLRPIKSGTIRIHQHRFKNWEDKAWSRLRNTRMGIVFQDYNLLRDLTVAENLALRMAIAGRSSDPKRMHEALDRVGMGNFLNTRVGSLSGGQQQRVAVVRALINDPDLVFADEPTGNLDDASAEWVIRQLIGERPDRTMIIATHDQRVLAHMDRQISFQNLEATR